MSEMEEILKALDAPERAARLDAIFRLGEALAGKGADPEAAAAVAKLEAIVADREKGTSWVRKRAKRALRKIRGEAGAEAQEGEAEATP